jgi:WD40 repeat protein
VVFSPDNRTIVSGSHDGTIRFWSVAARREVASINSGTPGVNSVIFSPDGNTLYAGCTDGTIRRWRAPSLQEIDRMEQADAWSQE